MRLEKEVLLEEAGSVDAAKKTRNADDEGHVRQICVIWKVFEWL